MLTFAPFGGAFESLIFVVFYINFLPVKTSAIIFCSLPPWSYMHWVDMTLGDLIRLCCGKLSAALLGLRLNRGLLETSIHLWVCTSYLGQKVWINTRMLLLANWNIAVLEHWVFRLRVGRACWFTRDKRAMLLSRSAIGRALPLAARIVSRLKGLLIQYRHNRLVLIAEVLPTVLIRQENRRDFPFVIFLCGLEGGSWFSKSAKISLRSLYAFWRKAKTRLYWLVYVGLVNTVVITVLFAHRSDR